MTPTPEESGLTRRQLREQARTEAEGPAPASRSRRVSTEKPVTPVASTPPVELSGEQPLTRRQARDMERARTGAIGVIPSATTPEETVTPKTSLPDPASGPIDHVSVEPVEKAAPRRSTWKPGETGEVPPVSDSIDTADDVDDDDETTVTGPMRRPNGSAPAAAPAPAAVPAPVSSPTDSPASKPTPAPVVTSPAVQTPSPAPTAGDTASVGSGPAVDAAASAAGTPARENDTAVGSEKVSATPGTPKKTAAAGRTNAEATRPTVPAVTPAPADPAPAETTPVPASAPAAAESDAADGDTAADATEAPRVGAAFGLDLSDPQSEAAQTVKEALGGRSFEALLGADAGSTAGGHSLILPAIPSAGGLSGPLSAAGDVVLTGSIDLPESLSSTGQHPNFFEKPEIDVMYEHDEDPQPATAGTPMSATQAVSSHTSARDVITPPQPAKNNRLLLILSITAGVLAIAVIGVAVVGFLTGGQ